MMWTNDMERMTSVTGVVVVENRGSTFARHPSSLRVVFVKTGGALL